MGRRGRRGKKTRKLPKQHGGHFNSLKFPGTLNVSLGGTQAIGQIMNSISVAKKTIETPVVNWQQPAQDSYRTLLCVDPDATAPCWLHWLVTNCTGTEPNSGSEIVKWEPPTPPPGTGLHTYYFCLFSHAYTLNIDAPKQRGYFDLEEFVKKNGLEPISFTTIRVRTLAMVAKENA